MVVPADQIAFLKICRIQRHPRKIGPRIRGSALGNDEGLRRFEAVQPNCDPVFKPHNRSRTQLWRMVIGGTQIQIVIKRQGDHPAGGFAADVISKLGAILIQVAIGAGNWEIRGNGLGFHRLQDGIAVGCICQWRIEKLIHDRRRWGFIPIPQPFQRRRIHRGLHLPPSQQGHAEVDGQGGDAQEHEDGQGEVHQDRAAAAESGGSGNGSKLILAAHSQSPLFQHGSAATLVYTSNCPCLGHEWN